MNFLPIVLQCPLLFGTSLSFRASTPSSPTRSCSAPRTKQPTGKADVVVAGAGILGLCYAIHLKNISPDLKIEVFERSLAPIQKIGESILSPFSTFTDGDVLPYNYLLRLFDLKDGIQFYNIDQDDREVTAHDVGGLDISFQLDRRMSELFMTMWAQSIGVNVYHGVAVDFEIPEGGLITSNLDDRPSFASFTTSKVILKDSSNSIGTDIDARIVCDASNSAPGRSSTPAGTPTPTGHTSAKKDTSNIDGRLLAWNYPATKHICFPEGWGWFIGVISWHHAPLANLMDLVAHVIASAAAGIPAEEFSCTRELSDAFACPYEFITSIGWAVRNDFKLPDDLSAYGAGEAEQKFNFFRKRYPVIDTLLTGSFELLPSYYGGRIYFVRKGLAYRSPIVVGEGWLAIGNSAGFTNSLISPGINVGIGGAWRAANLTAEVLATPVEEARNAMIAAVLDVLDGVNGGARPSEEQVQKALVINEPCGRGRRCGRTAGGAGKGSKTACSEGFLVEAKRCGECKYFVHNRADNCPICGEKDVWNPELAQATTPLSGGLLYARA
ncbi:hypothetical protein DFH08DRAFT_1053215 [Mycena albidolilacea]|uniref:Uncharacterized protein n=1 Tax=Mycena albidolilacea TaxID=1033008 RepID=A0AAD7AEU9_9AGAR|nr:hypothetical protein DFH08DRAFT_1053215 [Mycena albidolilacea]